MQKIKIKNIHDLAVEICKRDISESPERDIGDVKRILKLLSIIMAENYNDRDGASIALMLESKGQSHLRNG